MPIHLHWFYSEAQLHMNKELLHTFNSVDGIFSFQWLSIRNHLGLKLQWSFALVSLKITKVQYVFIVVKYRTKSLQHLAMFFIHIYLITKISKKFNFDGGFLCYVRTCLRPIDFEMSICCLQRFQPLILVDLKTPKRHFEINLPLDKHSQSSPSGRKLLPCLGLPSKSHHEN